MKNISNLLGRVAALSLVLTAVLMIVSTVVAPPFVGGAGQLAAISAAGPSATVSAMCFTLAQLFFVVGMVGIGNLVRPRAPKLAALGVALAVVGGFGHTVHGGVTMVQLVMASDVANHSTYAAVLEQLQSGPAAVFMLMGLLGTMLGILVLAMGLFRSRVVPRWAPVALWVFLLLEFGGSGISEWAGLASGVFYVAGLAAVAVTLWRDPAGDVEHGTGAVTHGVTASVASRPRVTC